MTGFIEWILGSETAANWNPEQYPFSNAADLMRSVRPTFRDPGISRPLAVRASDASPIDAALRPV